MAIVGLIAGGGGGWIATMPDQERVGLVQAVSAGVGDLATSFRREPRPYRHFAGCNDAQAAGYENITADEPSYRPEMDGDGDGVACEPYVG